MSLFDGEKMSTQHRLNIKGGSDGASLIEYTEEFEDVFGRLAYAIRNNIFNDLNLTLSAEAIRLNTASYSAWHFRRKCLFFLDQPLDLELQYTLEIGVNNPKNYQIWHHRRAIVEGILKRNGYNANLNHDSTAVLSRNRHIAQRYEDGSSSDAEFLKEQASREIAFIDALMNASDTKNIHAWSYRRFVMQLFGLWDSEAKFTEKLLEVDPRNNSAWVYRYFLLSKHVDERQCITKSQGALLQEIKFAASAISYLPHNSSPWHYIRGLSSLADLLDDRLVQTYLNILAEVIENAKSNDPNNVQAKVGAFGVAMKISSYTDAIRIAKDLAKTRPMQAGFWKKVERELSHSLSRDSK